MNDLHVGMHLKAYRKELGLSQEYIANKLDMSQPEVCHIESGRRGVGSELMRYMIEAGMLPEDTLNSKEETKLMLDRMEYKDTLLMNEFARRLMR